MKAVNLLPPTQRRARGFTGSRTPLAVAGAVLLVGGMGFWGYSVHSQVATVKDQVATASA